MTKLGKELSFCLIFLFPSIQAQAFDYPDSCGINKSYPGASSLSNAPYQVGQLCKATWAEIETSPNVRNWAPLDAVVHAATDQGLYAEIIIMVGDASPQWIYSNGVPAVLINWKGTGTVETFPYYFDDDYVFYFHRLIAAVRQHIKSYGPGVREKIPFVQAALGSTGDATPWHGFICHPDGTPDTSSPYNITSEQFDDFERQTYLYFRDQYAATNPYIFILTATNLSYMNDWVVQNCPAFWRKSTTVGHGYQLNTEAEDMAWLIPLLNSKYNGNWYRCRAELDLSDKAGWWSEAPRWNMEANVQWDLHVGLDYNEIKAQDLSNPIYWDSFKFMIKYAGKKDPATAPGAFCALRDGLDSADSVRFPSRLYGDGQRSNLARYLNIAEAFADHGAAVEDVNSLNGGAASTKEASGLNDVAWGIHPGNYQRYLAQYDPNGTSVGWWRVGPKEDRYGRFARGFEHVSGKDAMYFDLDDLLFGGLPFRAPTSVVVRIAYYDEGIGTWALRYDALDNPCKLALVVTKTDSEHWKEAYITLNDPRLGNRCPHGADLYLQNTDSEDDLFAIIEVAKAMPIPPDETATTRSATILATDDTYDSNIDPDSHFGAATYMKLKSTKMYSYVKFQISDTPNIQSAKLRVYSSNVVTTTSLYNLSSSAWTEETLTWNTKPAFTTLLGTQAMGGGWREFDVTGAVTGDGVYAFGFSSPLSAGEELLTKENSDGRYCPQLVVVYTPDVSFDADPIRKTDATAGKLYGGSIAGNVHAALPVTFSKTAGPDWVNLSSAGLLTGTPSNSDIGTNTLTACAQNALGEFDETHVMIQVLKAVDAPSSATFAPWGDTYARSTDPTRQYGTRDYITLGNNDGYLGYMKFDVNTHEWPYVTGVKLRVYNNTILDTITLYQVADTDWEERDLNYTNRPAMGDAITSRVVTQTNAWVEFDVRSYVHENGMFAFGLKIPGTDGTLCSKEGGASNGHAPELRVEFVPWSARTLGFKSDPFARPDATAGMGYGDSILDEAGGPDPYAAFVFSKVSGPAWLTVESNGFVSGAPHSPDVGLNQFVVRVQDVQGASDEATMTITVRPGGSYSTSSVQWTVY